MLIHLDVRIIPLLLLSIVSACDVYEREKQITLPEPPSAQEGFNADEHAQLTVAEDGTLTLNGTLVREEDLATAISNLPSTQVGNFPIISAHPDVRNGRIVQIRDIFFNSGYEQVELRLVAVASDNEN